MLAFVNRDIRARIVKLVIFYPFYFAEMRVTQWSVVQKPVPVSLTLGKLKIQIFAISLFVNLKIFLQDLAWINKGFHL